MQLFGKSGCYADNGKRVRETVDGSGGGGCGWALLLSCIFLDVKVR